MTPTTAIFWTGSVQSFKKQIPVVLHGRLFPTISICFLKQVRIPADPETGFVPISTYILSAAREKMEEKYHLAAQGYDMDKVAARVSELPGIRGPGISMAELSRRLRTYP